MPDYLTVTCRLPADAEGLLAESIGAWPVLGCQVEDAGGVVEVTVFLEESRAGSVPLVVEGLRALGARDVGSSHFADADWLAEYRRHVTPRPIGKLFWIDPHPSTPTAPSDGRVHLTIEPRQAFGTGSHESTQLVMLLLEEVPVVGARVLDVGTGSGILALAARTLGAEWALGFDIDVEAVFVARQTAMTQPSPVPVTLFAGTTAALRPTHSFDLILANLIPSQLEPLLLDVSDQLGPTGTVVISGVMADQRTAFEAELRRAGLEVSDRRELGEWVALVCGGERERVKK
ncbi:MAG: 50S ribosomal protein L11 methyltransferase [Acidobacteriota bacterium]